MGGAPIAEWSLASMTTVAVCLSPSRDELAGSGSESTTSNASLPSGSPSSSSSTSTVLGLKSSWRHVSRPERAM